MRIVDFYVGVLPEDRQRFVDFTHILSESDVDHRYKIYIKGEYNNPNGYFTFSVRGTWADYRLTSGQDFVKSIEHFEDDLT